MHITFGIHHTGPPLPKSPPPLRYGHVQTCSNWTSLYSVLTSLVADPALGGEGPRNIKSMWPHSEAIFLRQIFRPPLHLTGSLHPSTSLPWDPHSSHPLPFSLAHFGHDKICSLPPANEVVGRYVFTGVCLFTGGSVSSHHASLVTWPVVSVSWDGVYFLMTCPTRGSAFRCSIVYQPPVISGPPPLSLGPELQFCWLLALTLEPSADLLLFPFYPLPWLKSLN